MASVTANATIEGFITDLAFKDQTTNTSDLFPTSTANVAELSSNALSYFSAPTAITDKRAPTDRVVNWAAQTSPKIIIDEDAYPTFMNVVKNLANNKLNGFFKLVDKLLFDYEAAVTHAQIESLLTSDSDTKDIYVAGSFSVSTLIVSDTIYIDGGTPKTIGVPSYANFEIKLPSGSSTQTFVLKIYAGIDAWLKGYSRSIIEEVVPPLPYDKLFAESLGTATDNIFSTASLTATLSYNTIQARLKNTFVSGMVEYRAVLQDSANSVSVPFNIIYKGRAPTLFEIRNAIKEELLTSGVGDEASWKKRIPSVFVSGRFYLVPLWDKTYRKPDQLLFPSILNFNDIKNTMDQVLSTLGYSDITEYMDVLSIYYNHMSAAVVPDLSGGLDVTRLSTVVPDYQSYSPSDEQFAYMLENTRTFTRELNTVLTIDSDAQSSPVYGPNTEGLLSFYSFTVGSYEVCVITKLCYETVLESEQ